MCDIAGIHFENSVWNAPVPLSFQQLQKLNDSEAGAIVFKTVTRDPKIGKPNEWFLDVNGSYNNVSLHNDGIDVLIHTVSDLKPKKPIFISLYGHFVELVEMIDKLNRLEDWKILIEWNISCPNVQNTNIIVTVEALDMLKKYSKHPFGIKIGLNQSVDNLIDRVDFISAINTIKGRGGKDIHLEAVRFVQRLSNRTQVPIIGIGGAENWDDVNHFLDAGAIAVEIGTGYLRYGSSIFDRDRNRQILVNELMKQKIVKKGHFVFKSGLESDTYVDFRDSFSIPLLWSKIIFQALNRIKGIEFDVICGIPSGAIPLSTMLSFYTKKPLIVCRKNIKNYGTKRRIEGRFKEGDRCLLVEDVVTTGHSVMLMIDILRQNNIVVEDVFALLNRSTFRRFPNVRFRSLFRLPELEYHQLLEQKECSYVRQLKKIMKKKKSRLCFSADISDAETFIRIVSKVGPHIALLKVHYDILLNMTRDFSHQLLSLMEDQHFMILADRKLVDIGSTVSKQLDRMRQYPFQFVTAYLHSGEKMLEQIEEGVFLVAQMSTNQSDPLYTERVVEYAISNPNVCGLIAQEKLCDNVLHLVPGVRINEKGDGKGQIYRTPEEVRDFADLIIVGRGIYQSKNPGKIAQEYNRRMFR